MHFHSSDSNVFSPGEVVVVFRTNGTKTFGIVDKQNGVRLKRSLFQFFALFGQRTESRTMLRLTLLLCGAAGGYG
jgi:hypothetical protein